MGRAPAAGGDDGEGGALPVLLLSRTAGDASLAAAILGEAGMRVVPCSSADDLLGRIDEECGPMVIVSNALPGEALGKLARLLEDQPIWSDIPLLLFSGGGRVPTHVRRLISRRNTILMPHPIRKAPFVTAVRSAIGDRLRQFAMRDLLRQQQVHAKQLQRLALQADEAEEIERNRISRLLHDDLQQLLVGASYRLEALAAKLPAGESAEMAAEAKEVLERSLRGLRSLTRQLHSPVLQESGLADALKSLAGQMQTMHGFRVTIDNRAPRVSLDRSQTSFLYRAAQEFLFNAAKHSGVDEAVLSLVPRDDSLELSVGDRGRGFDARVLDNAGGEAGVGLLGIRERALYLGGRLLLSGRTGEGSVVTLVLPLQPGDGAVPHRRKGDRPAAGGP